MDFGIQKIGSMGHGPFECQQVGGKDASLAAMGGAETPVPGGSGRTYRHHEIAAERDRQAPCGGCLGGYSGTGQRPVQQAKED